MSKKEFDNLIKELSLLKIAIAPEYKFCKDRKFRADFMLKYQDKQCIVEYEGIYNSTKSRHTNVSGYSKDCEKYNLACLLGFPVLRYTASNYQKVTDDVIKIFGI